MTVDFPQPTFIPAQVGDYAVPPETFNFPCILGPEFPEIVAEPGAPEAIGEPQVSLDPGEADRASEGVLEPHPQSEEEI